MKEADKQIIRELNRIHDAVAAGSVAPAFADITGDPSDNAALGSALDAKQSEAEVQTIADAKVADTAYDATSWDGVTGIAPSKNAVRDKIESLSIPAAPSDTAYDATSWDGVTTIAPSKNAVRDKIEAVVASIPAVDIAAGVYNPISSDNLNIDGDPTFSADWQYMRINNIVSVAGRFDIDPTLTATTTGFDFTLPIASALPNPAGAGCSPGIVGQVVAVIDSGVADKARIRFKSSDVTAQATYITFMYSV